MWVVNRKPEVDLLVYLLDRHVIEPWFGKIGQPRVTRLRMETVRKAEQSFEALVIEHRKWMPPLSSISGQDNGAFRPS